MKTIKVKHGEITFCNLVAQHIQPSDLINKISDKMKYYYRRGDRYFFRGTFGEIVISGHAKELQLLKIGKEYIIECEY
ncbi:MAG: hypothetical protein M0P71_13200 [Melioribacteraceae bacterium]|jgi:hypothetical protein|nr:hypothetical protein [Melioribacteraceae bacterium]